MLLPPATTLPVPLPPVLQPLAAAGLLLLNTSCEVRVMPLSPSTAAAGGQRPRMSLTCAMGGGVGLRIGPGDVRGQGQAGLRLQA